MVVRDVPLSWQRPEIKNEIEDRYGNKTVRNIARMYGGDGRPILAIRLDMPTSSCISTLLNDGFVTIGHGRHAVKEYRRLIRISPPCYNCYEHGHLARQCKNPKRCSRCSEQHEGECSNEIRCANCGGYHYPGQSTCPVVQRLHAEKSINNNKTQTSLLHTLQLLIACSHRKLHLKSQHQLCRLNFKHHGLL